MIYSFFNTVIKGYLKYRKTKFQKIYTEPIDLQEEIFKKLIAQLKKTDYGKKYNAQNITDQKSFKNNLPITEYEDLFPYIQSMMDGKSDVLWPGKTLWFAKSSGTTNDRSKYIPITDDNLDDNHVASGWDAMTILYKNRPDACIFDGKNLIMGGSLSQLDNGVTVGDVSAILLDRMPAVGRPFYTPDFEVALMSDWEKKIDLMVEECIHEDVVMFAGVPTWTIVLFNKILEKTGKNNICEVWPNARTYFHGGVGFDPYVKQFKEFLPRDDFEYYEAYNASEGYFAVQDRLDEKGMLLLLDNAIYYEFIPIESYGTSNQIALSLIDVEVNKDYVMVISTSSGLWRYMPGDVVRFVTVMPYRVMVSGRSKHFINVFGEEVMVHNTDEALKKTLEQCGGEVFDYTVAPIFLNEQGKGGHEWLIDFKEPPCHLEEFSRVLDKNLRSVNSDYDAKRTKDIALQPLKISVAKFGLFNLWLKNKGKLGGQSKIPRLTNDRKLIEALLEINH